MSHRHTVASSMSRLYIISLILVACGWRGSPIASAAEPAAAAANATESNQQRDARMKWWREARFGMFIHWGVYSVPAGVYEGKPVNNIGEWIMHDAKIPVARYAEYAKEFNPVKFDADRWVQIAKEAGQKYIVITSKHHDGFAMFHSKASPYNIYDATPFKRDPLKELSEACRKQGIKLGFYYSQAQDWHHPGGAAGGGHWDKAQDGDMDKYLQEIAVPQIREILTNYGPVAVLWFDTDFDMTKRRADMILPLLKLQPDIIWNNRLGGGYRGDTETPEQNIPPTGYPGGRDWETCMTINDTWGYKSTDHHFKSTQTLLRNLIDIASKGGNYLLNVGPTAEGLIPQPEVDRLLEMGKWLKVNGEAIYGTGPNPFPRGRGRAAAWDWRATTKLSPDGSGKIYLHIFQWPADGQFAVTSSYKAQLVRAYLLADPNTVLDGSVTTQGDQTTFTIKLPANAPDPIASVVCLEVKP